MPIDRRLFLGGGAAALVGPGIARASIIAAGATPAQRSALTAIAGYLEDHRRHFGLPAMGMVVVDGGFTALIHSGHRNFERTEPLRPDDLWQIGSISKSFVAAICLQLASEHKIDLEADIRSVLPEAPLPDDGAFTIRGLLDHTTGLPDFAPQFQPDGGKLWRGFAAGSHWSYSNTGYDLLGTMIARIEGVPLARSIETRVCARLGMAATHGIIPWRDRTRFPASYSPLRPDRRGGDRVALAPAPWGDAALGAGSVASTLPDMAKYLRFMIGVGNGHGGPVVPDAMARLWLAKPVVQVPAIPAETYGMGLMHRLANGRALLHHTGGMVCFSSSFHVDPAAGTGAFASCAVGGTGYRPRLLTMFAVEAMRCAGAGLPLPMPTDLGRPPVKAADFAGSFGPVTIRPDLQIVAFGKSSALEPIGPDMFISQIDDLPLLFNREAGAVTSLAWGSARHVRDGRTVPALPPVPPHIAARAGRYQTDDPWVGGITLVARGDTLFADGTDPLVDIGSDTWRSAASDWDPERVRFAGFVDGRPQLLIASGRVLERRDG